MLDILIVFNQEHLKIGLLAYDMKIQSNFLFTIYFRNLLASKYDLKFIEIKKLF